MKRARERVRDDAALISEVASTVSGALGLGTTNRTLGRNIVIAALDSHIAAESGKSCSSAVSSSITEESDDHAAINEIHDKQRMLNVEEEHGSGEAGFRKKAKSYGPLGDDMLSGVFQKVTTRLRGALVQLQAMQEEEDGLEASDVGSDVPGGGSNEGVSGFAKPQRLSGFGVGGALKGGLLKKPTFQVIKTVSFALPFRSCWYCSLMILV